MLYFLFFCSGATGLVYETVWGRELHLVFGTSQFAIATVLAAFMTGLSLGGWLAGRLAQRLRNPMAAYAALEATIGLFALGFPWIRDAIAPVYLDFFRQVSPTPVVFGAFQFLLLGSALLVPTACMGATLPVLARFVARPVPEDAAGDTAGEAASLDPMAPEAPRARRSVPPGPGAIIGRLYAVNTAGAVFGVWLVGFYLLPDLGVRATTVAAASANLALAATALWLGRGTRLEADAARAVSTAPLRDHRWLGIAMLCGLGSLGLEVAWFRLMALVLGASTYAFSVMLLAFLIGIAGGGYLGGAIAERLAPAHATGADARMRVARGVALAQIGVAALAWGAMWLWPYLPISFVWLYFQIRLAPELLWAMKCVLAMAVMTPAALGMGISFPLLTRAAGLDAGDAPETLSRTVGRVYAANTLGSLCGAFLAGFVWLPQLGVSGTTLLCVGINVLAATVAWWRPARTPALAAAALAAAGVLVGLRPPWEPLLMTSGIYKYVDNLQEPTMAHLRRLLIDRYQLLYYNEGLSTVVTVARDRTSGNQWLANNGKIDASTSADMPTQVLVAHLPMMLLPPASPAASPAASDAAPRASRDAMLIGLASGITLGALTLHPDLDRIDVVELEPSMPKATALFQRYNHDALSDPRVRILGNDGRNQLLLSPPQSYDIIVAEPSNPWLTGVSNLFTHEFFEMGKSRLKPGGVWSQWVQMYGMDSRDLKSVMRTFCESFPHVLFFSSILDADMVMVGSNEPIVMTEDLAARLVHKTVGLEGEFANIGVIDGYDLLADYLFDRDQALAMTDGIPLNTDDNLLVEYSAPKNLHRTTSSENMLMLLPEARVPAESVQTVDGLVRLADAYAVKEDLIRALVTLKEAESREPGRADVGQRYNWYQRRLKEQLK